MSKKTSFKSLLSKTASNPQVNLQGVRAQRDKFQQLKSGEPPAKVARTAAPPPKSAAPPSRGAAAAPPPSAPPPSRANELAPPTAEPSASSTSFMPAGMFAGRRLGFVFKAGERGLGYYRDGDAPHVPASDAEPDAQDAASPADADAAAAAARGSGSALPQGFFDNPQLDPANRGKEVAQTVKDMHVHMHICSACMHACSAHLYARMHRWPRP